MQLAGRKDSQFRVPDETGGFGPLRIEVERRFRLLTSNDPVVFLRNCAAFKLMEETAQSKCAAGDGILLDGQHACEFNTIVCERVESFAEPAGPRKDVDNGYFAAAFWHSRYLARLPTKKSRFP